jgi:hypothetical protein
MGHTYWATILFSLLIGWEGRCVFTQASLSASHVRSTCPIASSAENTYVPLSIYSYSTAHAEDNIQIDDVVGVFHFSSIVDGAPHYVRDSAAGIERHLFRDGLRWYLGDDTTLGRIRAYYDTMSPTLTPPGQCERLPGRNLNVNENFSVLYHSCS